METDPKFVSIAVGGANFGGRIYCGVDILGGSDAGAQVYAYFLCQEFYNNEGKLAEGTGTGAAVLLQVRGSGARTEVTSWRLPDEGAGYGPSVERMFPREIAQKLLAITSGNASPPSIADLRARAASDLARGVLRPTSGPSS